MAVQLPIIDIGDPSSIETGKQMVDAAVQYGFLYISTEATGFSEELVDRQFSLSRDFFSSPLEQKQRCQIGTDNRGWAGVYNENLDPKSQSRGDSKEIFNLGEFKEGLPQQTMPEAFSTKIADLAEFESICKHTCNVILDLIGLGLEVQEESFFSSRHAQPSGSIVRMLKYPAAPEKSTSISASDIRAGAHSDYGSITLLFQRPGQPGLEIRTPDDRWAPVAVIPAGYHSKTHPPILVNIGDLMSYWTNGLLKSTVHRVVNSKDLRDGDRYSIVYFCHPRDDTELISVPSSIVQQHKLNDKEAVGHGGGISGARAMTAKEHLINRLNATYEHRIERKT